MFWWRCEIRLCCCIARDRLGYTPPICVPVCSFLRFPLWENRFVFFFQQARPRKVVLVRSQFPEKRGVGLQELRDGRSICDGSSAKINLCMHDEACMYYLGDRRKLCEGWKTNYFNVPYYPILLESRSVLVNARVPVGERKKIIKNRDGRRPLIMCADSLSCSPSSLL